jgi:hypothetical protein
MSNHQLKIALDTLRMSETMAAVAGGPNLPEAIKWLRTTGMSDALIKRKLRRHGHSEAEITDLFNRD